jgi:hypothetical protein
VYNRYSYDGGIPIFKVLQCWCVSFTVVTRRDTIVFLDYFGSWEPCLPFVQTEVSMSGYIGFCAVPVC